AILIEDLEAHDAAQWRYPGHRLAVARFAFLDRGKGMALWIVRVGLVDALVDYIGCCLTERHPAGDDAGHMGAVAVSIDGRLGALYLGKVPVKFRDRGMTQRLVRREMRVILVHPGIDHGPDDVPAIGGERARGGIRLYGRDRPVERGANGEVRPYLVDRYLRAILSGPL